MKERLQSLARNAGNDRLSILAAIERAYEMGVEKREQECCAKGEVTLNIAQLEKLAIAHALLMTKGDMVKAAELLGIGKTTVYRKCREMNIPSKNVVPVRCPNCSSLMPPPMALRMESWKKFAEEVTQGSGRG